MSTYSSAYLHQQKKIPFRRTGHLAEEIHSAPTTRLTSTLFGEARAEPRLRNAVPAETGLLHAAKSCILH